MNELNERLQPDGPCGWYVLSPDLTSAELLAIVVEKLCDVSLIDYLRDADLCFSDPEIYAELYVLEQALELAKQRLDAAALEGGDDA